MLYGLGTRPLTNIVLQQFTDSYNGIFFREQRMVDRHEKTVWNGFDEEKWIESKTPVCVFGNLRGTADIVYKAEEHEIDYYYFDHAYVYKSVDHIPDSLLNLRVYRITKNAEALNKLIEWDKHKELVGRIQKFERMRKIKVRPQVYRNGKDKHILVLPPTEFICKFMKLGSKDQWINNTIEKIQQYTDRDIIIREKGDKTPIGEQMRDAYCMVSSQTTAVIDAVRYGLPSFCDTFSCGNPVSKNDLSEIENPHYPTEEEITYWINSMISAQFTETEIQSGFAKRIIEATQ